MKMENLGYKKIMGRLELIDQSKLIHYQPDDFKEGNLETRFEEYGLYRLELIHINEIDVDEWIIYDDLIDEITEEIKNDITTMPLPVITDYFSILDGSHRLTVLKNLGFTHVYVYKGIHI